ncbi:hypothetical protein ABEF92_003946 [Exophiala dermatitidis]|uniref:Uncharacterized protein n=1 Tax=Exophiala dermatitidis (strain ATCC 34100 / CBS 525.76 / NIH/UT8656) TaxID=858893 RepID=H6C9U7_EXODN|nr:uncharacterized protein HMPREF1120_07926 [Exophiala dermatitidis NIH/UT8656]EHY59950.1 hypothetical protein HMPREF1120_07926 [Exophiala dermatitidis NIH/UT8656]
MAPELHQAKSNQMASPSSTLMLQEQRSPAAALTASGVCVAVVDEDTVSDVVVEVFSVVSGLEVDGDLVFVRNAPLAMVECEASDVAKEVLGDGERVEASMPEIVAELASAGVAVMALVLTSGAPGVVETGWVVVGKIGVVLGRDTLVAPRSVLELAVFVTVTSSESDSVLLAAVAVGAVAGFGDSGCPCVELVDNSEAMPTEPSPVTLVDVGSESCVFVDISEEPKPNVLVMRKP